MSMNTECVVSMCIASVISCGTMRSPYPSPVPPHGAEVPPPGGGPQQGAVGAGELQGEGVRAEQKT